MTTLRWGIMSTGWIATEAAKAIALLPDAEVIAVGSRSAELANTFADRWNIPNRHARYDALVADPDVDVVYIGTPHPFHMDNTLLALRAGKPVLLEKPFTINAAQAETLIQAAHDAGVFLMEAMWTRFVPANSKLREMVRGGAIGDVQILFNNLTLSQPYDMNSRLYNPKMGGGSLLDLGVYAVSHAHDLLGTPDAVQSRATMAPTGVDQHNGMMLTYHESGAIAMLATSMRGAAPCETRIIGSVGTIHVPDPFYAPVSFTLERPEHDPERFEFPYDARGFHFQFDHVHQCLKDGATESPILPLDETLRVMQTLDTVRAQWGLRYPME